MNSIENFIYAEYSIPLCGAKVLGNWECINVQKRPLPQVSFTAEWQTWLTITQCREYPRHIKMVINLYLKSIFTLLMFAP